VSGKLTVVRLGVLWKRVKNQLVIKCERTPKIGIKVYDSSLREVGEVVSIFGPTSQPFAEVRTVKKLHPRSCQLGNVFYMLCLEKSSR
jgi:rRNA processing protein Gar1